MPLGSIFDSERKPILRKRWDGSPPPWYGWVSPSTGMAALVISCIGLGVSYHNYTLATKSHDEMTAPKLSVSQLSLTHPRGKSSDLPVLAFQVQNHGALTLYDVHTFLNYTYRPAPVDYTKPAMPVGSNNEGSGAGSILIPGDWLDKSFPIFGPFNPGQTKPTTSYSALKDGLATMTVDINTESNDTSSKRVITCDEFEYVWLTDKFERRGLCVPWDFTKSFRSPDPHGTVVTTLPQDSRIPK
jgi:hypothetical protein